MYITKCADKITPFGGINFCFNSYHQSGLAGLTDRYLGDRGGATGFSYSEIMANLMGVFFAGGDCAEDLSEHLSGPLGCPSSQVINPDSGVAHQFNINAPLNGLMLGALRTTGQLKQGNR
jgi:hypothetical protein